MAERDYAAETTPIDEAMLASYGWKAMGNTWYPPESSHHRRYESPILYWVRVDGTLRLVGSEWTSGNDATQNQLFRLCDALSIQLAKEQP